VYARPFYFVYFFLFMANPASQYNVNTYFVPIKGQWVTRLIRMAASTAISQGVAVGVEISGNTTTGNATTMGTENASGADFIGILQETIASTDADYATAGKLKLVAVPLDPTAEAEFKVISGTFTTADINKTVEFASSGTGLAVDTAGKGARITGYIDSARGTCQFTLPTTETA